MSTRSSRDVPSSAAAAIGAPGFGAVAAVTASVQPPGAADTWIVLGLLLVSRVRTRVALRS
ncbi:hypothetical protein BWI15_25555 [Kribbella sp. ALI-6-A]|nr:hypothetical protein BWI15_25555 [Kribbella sp. ALI-6-A]